MTVIVAIKYKKTGDVYIGSDSAISSGNNIEISKNPKICSKPFNMVDENGNKIDTRHLIIGFSGIFSIFNFIRYSYKAPDYIQGTDFRTYLINSFLYCLKTELELSGLVDMNGTQIKTNSNFLIVYNGDIFEIEDNLGLFEPDGDYVAIGVGKELALGSLYSTKRNKPSNRIKKAIEATAYHSLYVNDKYDWYRITEDDYK
jgi:ATP-dependent protease HslVU (ClpYQ) peptidase subunit